MKTIIDLETWSRTDHYNLFRKYDVPFWSVSANVDVTRAYHWCKEDGNYPVVDFVNITEGILASAGDIKFITDKVNSEPVHPDLSRERIIALEDDVNSWFDIPKRYGFQLVYRCRSQAIGFQLRYGEMMGCDGLLRSNTLTKRTIPRPEDYIFILYVPDERRLEIHAKKLGETRVLVILLGKHLFGDMNHFFPEGTTQHYTLAPIREGRDVLTCSDVNRLNHVALAELDIILPGNCDQTLRSETCLFDDWNRLTSQLDFCHGIKQASFLMYVAGLSNPRKLTICTPSTAIFQRADGVDTICFQWLKNRKIAQ